MPQTKNELILRLQTTTEELLGLISNMDDDTFNRKPENGGWSAAEVAEHLLIFDKRLNLVLESAVHPTDRDITANVAIFTPRVTNREAKLEAPPFLIPSGDRKSVPEITAKIRAERARIISKITESDLSLHSKEYPHRFFGEMTAQEWVIHMDLHTKRHIEQLKEMS